MSGISSPRRPMSVILIDLAWAASAALAITFAAMLIILGVGP